MDSRTVSADVTVADEVYSSFPRRPDRVRECVAAAASAMGEVAAERGRVLGETPRLVDQRNTGLGFVRLTFHASTVTR